MDAVRDIVKERGLLRPCDLEAEGLPPRYLRRLHERGELERIGRGLYRDPDAPVTAHHSLAVAAKRYPDAVVCLLSALQYHELTTQWPRAVWVARDQGAWTPEEPPVSLRLVRMSGPALHEGIEEHVIEKVPVKIFGPAKTVADCFKFRSKIGLEVAIEALRDFHRQQTGTMDALWHFAKVCRVTTVIKPYMEAIV
jgi:predicted transcriptional regulator of viral defense system